MNPIFAVGQVVASFACIKIEVTHLACTNENRHGDKIHHAGEELQPQKIE